VGRLSALPFGEERAMLGRLRLGRGPGGDAMQSVMDAFTRHKLLVLAIALLVVFVLLPLIGLELATPAR
jgi:hypothetical protein